MSNPERTAVNHADLLPLAVQLVEKRVSLLLDQWRSRAISTGVQGKLNSCSGDMSDLFGFNQTRVDNAEQLTIYDGVHGYYYVCLDENSPLPPGKAHLQKQFDARHRDIDAILNDKNNGELKLLARHLLNKEIEKHCTPEWERLAPLSDWHIWHTDMNWKLDSLDDIVQYKIATMDDVAKIRLVAKYRLIQFRTYPSLDEFVFFVVNCDHKGRLFVHRGRLPYYASYRDFVDILNTKFPSERYLRDISILQIAHINLDHVTECSRSKKHRKDAQKFKKAMDEYISKSNPIIEAWHIYSCTTPLSRDGPPKLEDSSNQQILNDVSFKEMKKNAGEGRASVLIRLSHKVLFQAWTYIRNLTDSTPLDPDIMGNSSREKVKTLINGQRKEKMTTKTELPEESWNFRKLDDHHYCGLLYNHDLFDFID